MLRILARFLLSLSGWLIDDNLPKESKYVLVGAPHTSNWDLLLLLLGMMALGFRFDWVGKHTLFKWPVGSLLKAIGGIPVDRRIRSGFVSRMVDLFNSRENFILMITPEGTRSKATYWKTAFYYIALQAKVPIALGYIDYGERKLGVGKTVLLSGDIVKDFEVLRDFYEGKKGKYPEQQGEVKVYVKKTTKANKSFKQM